MDYSIVWLYRKFKSYPDIAYPLTALLINILVFWRWLNINAIFASGDWGFFFHKTQIELLNFSPTWSASGIGKIELTLSGFPLHIMQGITAHIVSFAVNEKVTFMYPIIVVSSLGSYYFVRNQGLGRLPSLVGSLVFTLNTYNLILATGHLNLMAADAFCLPTLIFFQNYIRSSQKLHLCLSLLSAFMIVIYDLRILYILSVILFLYVLFYLYFEKNKSVFNVIKRYMFWLAGIVLINLFWLISLAKLGQVTDNELFSRGLFGNEYLNLSEALTLFHPFWTGSKTAIFAIQPIPIYFWVIPLLALFGLYFNRKNRIILFFGATSILGILLTKQADTPFPDLYLWLYQHMPGFNAFREASKFYLFITLGYSVLIAAFVDWLLKKKKNSPQTKYAIYICIMLIGVLFLWNSRPFIKGDIATVFTPRTVPSDYQKLEKFIQNQPEYFRTFWIPTSSKFGVYGYNHPKVEAVDIVNNTWKNFFDDVQEKDINTVLISSPFNNTYSPKLFSEASIKYVVVPLRDQKNDDDFYIYYGNDRQTYIDLLSKTSWLKRVNIGTSNLAVYENINFKPYFSSFTNLFNVPSINNLNESFLFAKSELKANDFEFNVNKERPNLNQKSVVDFFDLMDRGNLNNGIINRSFSTNKNQQLTIYANNNRPVIDYTVKNSILTFNAQKLAGPNIQNESTGLVQGSSESIGSSLLDLTKEYYVNIGTDLFKVDTSKTTRNLGIVKEAPTILKASSQNLIENSSLENGLWKTKVEDCNNYDDDGQINMWIAEVNKTEGDKSLALASNNHTACTGPNKITVTPGKQYLLSFDYKVQNGQQAGYEIDFINSKTKPIKKDLYIHDSSWRQEISKITIPGDTKTIQLKAKGYPDIQRKYYAITWYDNFRLSPLDNVSQSKLDTTPKYSQTVLNNINSVSLKYANKTLNYRNLIKNSDFQQGLWQKTVGDCNAYDDKPQIDMKLSSVHSVGAQKSLELSAARHTACTSPQPLSVKENSKYLLSFDYQSPNASNAGYYVAFNDQAHTVVSEHIEIKNSKWSNFTKTITAPYGATNMQLVVYAFSGEIGSQKIINRYDNFYMTEIPDIADQYYLVSSPSGVIKKPKTVTFNLNSPTKKTIHIKGATTSFYLAMSEAYHPQWKLEFNNSKIKGLNSWILTAKPDTVAEHNHIKLNDFENGWYIDVPKLCGQQKLCHQNADGSYDLEMIAEFTPQRYFYIGLIISGVTLAGCVCYLLKDHLPKRKKDKEKVYVAKR